MWRQLFFSIVLGATVVIGVEAQTSGGAGQTGGGAPQPLPVARFVNLNSVSTDYQVGPGDLLDIQVVGRAELSQSLRISNSGEINVLMIGPVRVADLTAFEVEDAIAARLREKGLIERPEVLVFIRDYRAKPIYVSGGVASQGEFVMSQEMTVADAILLAGGLQFNAASDGFVQRRSSGKEQNGGASEAVRPGDATPDFEIIRVDLRPMKEGRFFEAALPLRPGDVVVVPQERMYPFFVVGEVLDPRNYFYPPDQVLTASQAISWAKGPTMSAKMSQGLLVRYDDRGRRTELKVDYAAILKGTQKDFPIQPNDVIFIPGSTVKTIGHAMLQLTDTMTMSAAFRVGRTYQLPDVPERPVREPR